MSRVVPLSESKPRFNNLNDVAAYSRDQHTERKLAQRNLDEKQAAIRRYLDEQKLILVFPSLFMDWDEQQVCKDSSSTHQINIYGIVHAHSNKFEDREPIKEKTPYFQQTVEWLYSLLLDNDKPKPDARIEQPACEESAKEQYISPITGKLV